MCPTRVNKALHDLTAISGQPPCLVYWTQHVWTIPCFLHQHISRHHAAADLLGLQYASMSITVLLLSVGPTKGYIWDIYVHSQNR